MPISLRAPLQFFQPVQPPAVGAPSLRPLLPHGWDWQQPATRTTGFFMCATAYFPRGTGRSDAPTKC